MWPLLKSGRSRKPRSMFPYNLFFSSLTPCCFLLCQSTGGETWSALCWNSDELTWCWPGWSHWPHLSRLPQWHSSQYLGNKQFMVVYVSHQKSLTNSLTGYNLNPRFHGNCLLNAQIHGNRLTSLVRPTLQININAAKNSILSHGMNPHWLTFYGLGNTDPCRHCLTATGFLQALNQDTICKRGHPVICNVLHH